MVSYKDRPLRETIFSISLGRSLYTSLTVYKNLRNSIYNIFFCKQNGIPRRLIQIQELCPQELCPMQTLFTGTLPTRKFAAHNNLTG